MHMRRAPCYAAVFHHSPHIEGGSHVRSVLREMQSEESHQRCPGHHHEEWQAGHHGRLPRLRDEDLPDRQQQIGMSPVPDGREYSVSGHVCRAKSLVRAPSEKSPSQWSKPPHFSTPSRSRRMGGVLIKRGRRGRFTFRTCGRRGETPEIQNISVSRDENLGTSPG